VPLCPRAVNGGPILTKSGSVIIYVQKIKIRSYH
jgi:hypothetical protein